MAKRNFFHPTFAVTWWQFILGTLIGGVLLGIGWEIGATMVNKYFDNTKHMASVGARRYG